MPILTRRNEVLDLYAEAAVRHWVFPLFLAENSTTTEAILTAAQEYAQKTGQPDLPIMTGLTNTYASRPQAEYYTHTRNWKVGLRRFLGDLHALCDAGAPFSRLRVLVHLDHIQWDTDAELWNGDLSEFSSIMFDASNLPLDQNIRLTAKFVAARGRDIVIEGACDEIREANEQGSGELTSPELAERFKRETGVDILVTNLGTEHRASRADLRYHGEMARAIRDRVGTCLCLHGTSSVPPDHLRSLFDDGIMKVNLWTALERDSAPALLEDMARNAGRVGGPRLAQRLVQEGVLGPTADARGPADLKYFSTTHRQDIVFREMKQIVTNFLNIWYV
jgi:fructose-bisphosphate aldolase class II